MAVAGPRRKMWAVEMAVVVLGLLAMAVQPSMQQILRNPMDKGTPALAIIATSSNTEKALNESGIFTVNSYVELFGRRFLTGKIGGSDVVYVNSANRPAVHVGITVQILADYFDLKGIIHLGSAGGVNNSLSLGDVVVPRLIGNIGVWTWKKFGDSTNGQLKFAKFNYPENGDNLLASIEFDASEVYKNGSLKKNVFNLLSDAKWRRIASKIKEIGTTDNCLGPRNCLSTKYKVVVGLKSGSSDIYINNYDYREFLWHTFKISTVDTTSHAVGLGAKSNNLPFIVFRGVSNTAGASDETNSPLANANVVKVLHRFIKLLTVESESEIESEAEAFVE